MNRLFRPTVFVSLCVTASIAMSGCTAGESRETAATATPPSAAVTTSAEPTSTAVVPRGAAIKQLLDEYEQPADAVIFTGETRVNDGSVTYSFRLTESAYAAYLTRVGQSGGEPDNVYTTNFEESPWLWSPEVGAMPSVDTSGEVSCQIWALPWVPAAGGHVPPLTDA